MAKRTKKRGGGRRSKGLTVEQIARLDVYRKTWCNWSWPQVLATMVGRPFGLDTLLRARDGERISERNHTWLSEWIQGLNEFGGHQGARSDAACTEPPEEAVQHQAGTVEATSTPTKRGSR